jgi:alpha-glucosidase
LKASREGIQAANPQKRPFVLSRANFLGGQRYAATWTGDNISSTEHMKLSIPMSLTLGLSGQPFNGPDIGGFVGSPSPELLGQWMALGAFYPFSRNHTSIGTADQEPWAMGGEIEEVSRLALMRRYQLLPYLYSLFHQSASQGLPVMQPVFMADPTDAALRTEEEAFMWGDALIIIPSWSDDPAIPAGDWYEIDVVNPNETSDGYQARLLLKEGSILPVGQPIQSTVEYEDDSITLLVNVDDALQATGWVYDDLGDGYEHLMGDYSITAFQATAVNDDTVRVEATLQEGSRSISERVYRVGMVRSFGTIYSDWTSDHEILVPLPPDVSYEWVQPANGQQFDLGETISIQIEVSGAEFVESVELRLDGEVLEAFDEVPFTYQWTPDRSAFYVLSGTMVLKGGARIAFSP